MPDRPAHFDEMLALAEQQCNGALSREGVAQLERLLIADGPLRREYLRYSFLHAHLVLTDEVVGSLYDDRQLRAMTDQDELEACLAELPESSFASLLRKDRRPAFSRRKVAISLTALCAAAALTAAALISMLLLPSPRKETPWRGSIARVTQTSAAQWTDDHNAPRRGQQLGPGTLRLRSGQAGVMFRNGAEISLDGPATFGVESESHASLFAGRLRAKLSGRDEQFVLQAQAVRVIDRGTEFGVEVGADGTTEVHCLAGKVETQSRARLPMFYWSFDEAAGPVVDSMSRQEAKMGAGATRVGGIVGPGAVSFDNSSAAYVNVGNGGGTQFGAGEFGVSSGLTIEVLTIVRWSGEGVSNGKSKDYDEIFRKEDGAKRMLLSFQNDGGAYQRNVPAMSEYGPTLSFGLHLAGDGYSELEARLDGRQAPTLESLRDGRPHHIIATYNSWTGVKAIYIDGAPCGRAQFAEGTLIEAGGPTDAIIGNLAGGGEPYAGVIDEVAIYDFALSGEEVAEHWRNVQSGGNYFGTDAAKAVRRGTWTSTRVLTAGEAMQFDSRSGLPLREVPVNYDRFRKS